MKSVLLVEDGAVVAMADIFKLLGDPTRLRLVLACMDRECAVNEIAARLRLSPSLASHHLRLLRAARIVRAERRGKHVFYALADEHIRSVLDDLIAHASEEIAQTPARERARS